MMNIEKLAFDRALTHRSKDENGFLRVNGCHITKETINPYYGREIPGWREAGLDPERIYYGYRAGKELERAAHSFEGLPLLKGHHIESAEDPQKEFRVGSSGTDAVWNAPYLDNSLFITDIDAIRDIEEDKAKEISCAYLYDPDFTPGEWEGQSYDFVMRNIRGNHIALVEEGRAGADVVVADAQIQPSSRMRSFMDWFKKFRGAMDADIEAPEAPEEESEMEEEVVTDEDRDGKLKAMFAALKDAGKISDEEFAALKAAAFGEEQQEEKVDEEKSSVRDVLNDAADKIEALGVEEEEVNPAARPEEEEAEDEEDEELDEAFLTERKAAADRCGMDAESPEFQKAFAEGVRYGEGKEKAEPKKLDREHESEGMKEEEVREAMDAALRISAKRGHDATMRKFRELSAAADATRSVLGNIDALAFDSADAIYGAALKKSGIDIRKHPRSAWRSMFLVLSQSRQDSVRIAQDSTIGKAYEGAFAGFNRIKKG